MVWNSKLYNVYLCGNHHQMSLRIIFHFVDKPSQREDLTAVAGSYTEPRRSSRQRREVYGTLNETMLVRNSVPAKGHQERDRQVRC